MQSYLVVNVGSTSLKFKLIAFEPPDLETPKAIAAEGRIEGIGQPRSTYRIQIGEKSSEGETALPGHGDALKLLLEALDERAQGDPADPGALGSLSAIVFKPVHARDVPLETVEMDDAILGRMADFNALAPAHNPPVIAAVRALRALAPRTPLLGLFEPAFHAHLAPRVYAQSVPAQWIEEFGIRKYGFHGASHRYIAERVPQYLGVPARELKMISCHLGGSSSLAAIRNGQSVETTMAFTPQSGLPQGTRCGDIDPFIPIYLIKEKGWSVDRVEEALAQRSGLLGLSGVSAEFREIEAEARTGNKRAQWAIEVFTYQVQCAIASMTVALGGFDTLVFTGGIGERSAGLRAGVCAGLEHLGVRLDEAKNEAALGREAAIHAGGSNVRVLVLPTDEELVLARAAARYRAERG